MKITHTKLLLWPALAASLIAAPLYAQSPERGRPDGPPPAREGAPNPERIQRVVREMAELHKAGKHEEAKKLSERLREVAKDNPEAARKVFEALREQRQQAAKPDAPKDEPRHQPRPSAPPQAKREPMNPPAPPNARPHQDPREQPRQGPPPFARPEIPQGPQGPMPMARPHPPQGPQQGPMPMARPNIPHGPQAGAPGQPQRPNVAAAREQVTKLRHLKVAAGHLAAAGYPEYAAKAREEAGRIESVLKQHMPQPQRPMLQSRELRQDHPAFPRPEAAKDKCPMQGKIADARKEAAKKEAAKKEAAKKEVAKKELAKKEAAKKEAAKEVAKKEAAKKEAGKKDDASPLLREMQKLNKQMSDLNNRVRKLEKEEDDD